MLLRQARLSHRSPSGSGRPLSRQELADAVNAAVHAARGGRTASAIDANYIGKLERGEH
ncbi:MAG: transcriptional regulator, partial [Actinocatenispora sp.]